MADGGGPIVELPTIPKQFASVDVSAWVGWAGAKLARGQCYGCSVWLTQRHTDLASSGRGGVAARVALPSAWGHPSPSPTPATLSCATGVRARVRATAAGGVCGPDATGAGGGPSADVTGRRAGGRGPPQLATEWLGLLWVPRGGAMPCSWTCVQRILQRQQWQQQ